MLYLVEGSAAGGDPAEGSLPSSRARALTLLAGLLVLCTGVVWLVLPRSPSDGSAEVGFAGDLLVHDAPLREVLAALDVAAVDDQTRELLLDIDEVVAGHDQRASGLLSRWGQAPSADRVPMGWMGHVLEGNTPGAIPGDLLVRSGALGSGDVEMVMAALVGHLRGGVLMARGILAISDNADLEAFAADLAEDRNQLRDRVEGWFVDQGYLPPTWLPEMTTDPGNLDHGDPVTSVGAVGRNAVRWLPVAVGLALIVGAALTWRGTRRPGLIWAASVAAGVAGIGHLAVAGAHGDDAVVSGVFLVFAGVGQVAVAAALVARPSAWLLNVAATVAGALTVVYVTFRTLPPPGSVGPADVDLAGAIIVALQLVVVAVWALRPLGGDLVGWGADMLAYIGSRGASAGVVVLSVGLAGVVGFAIGEADSRPPSKVDVGFAQDMIAHHAQAVQMAQLVDGRLENATVETIAREVVLFQQYEAGIFDTRLREWGAGRTASTTMDWMGIPMPLAEMPGIASEAQLTILRNAQGERLDQVFLTLLGAHHVGGVQMAAFAAQNADDGAMADLAALIARNQRLEINEFRFIMDSAGLTESAGSLSAAKLAELTELAVSE